MSRRFWSAIVVLALAALVPASLIVSARQADLPATGPVPQAPGGEDNPYTLEWLQKYHGLVDNRWTAQYEQQLQGAVHPASSGRSDPWLLPLGGPLFGADVRLSNPSFNTQQNEFQVDINPLNHLFAINTSNDYLTAGVGIYRTSDGGATWTAFDAPFGAAGCCDPGVAYAADGKVYVSGLSFSGYTYVISSTDNGMTWSPRSQAAVPDRPNIVVDNGPSSPYFGTVYLTYSDLPTTNRIKGYRSTDGGLTWGSSFFIGDVAPPNGYEQSSQPRVASDGTLYVGYQQYTNSNQGCSAGVQNVVARSTDGGTTWTYTVLPIIQGGVCLSSQAGRGVFCYDAAGSYFRSRSHPIMSVHPTNPQHVYMVYSGGDLETAYSCAGGTGFHSDTLFRKSTDGGVTWTAPLKINTDPSGKDQYYPWMDVAPDGTIWVGWHDRREDANNYQHRWYTAYSTDEGTTWTETPVADVMSLPYNFIGDYAGLAAENDRVLGVWWDSRIKSSGDPYTDPHVPGGATPTPTETPAGPSPTPTPTNTPPSGVWQSIAPVPTAVSRPAGAFANGKFFVISGEQSDGTRPGTVQIFDPVAGTWSIGPNNKPTGVSNTCAAVIGNDIYVPAGYDGASGVTSLDVLDATALTWSTITTDPVPQPLFALTCGEVNGKLYIAGGSTTGVGGTQAYVYDPAAPAGTRWSAIASLNVARAYPGGVGIGGKFYVAGGWGSSTSDQKNSVEVYDPATNAWTLFANNMSVARGGPGAHASGILLIVCAGGWTQYYNTCESYDTTQGTTGTWSAFPAMITGRRTYAYASSSTTLYAGAGYAGAFLTAAEKIESAQPTPTPTSTPTETPTETPLPPTETPTATATPPGFSLYLPIILK